MQEFPELAIRYGSPQAAYHSYRGARGSTAAFDHLYVRRYGLPLVSPVGIRPRVHYVGVELDTEAVAGVKANVSQYQYFKDDKDFAFRDLQPAIDNSSFDAILIAGGSPCQGNSRLNPGAAGLDDTRTML